MIAGSDNLNIYTKFEERVGITTFYLWLDTGGAFVNSNEYPKESQGVEDFILKYELDVQEKIIKNQMIEQEKELSKLEKDLEKLEKKNIGFHKDIENAKEKIEESEKNIEQNLSDQDDQRVRIEKQKKMIEEIIERLNNLGKG